MVCPLIGCDCRLINDRPVGGGRPGDPVPSQEEAIKSLPAEKELHLPAEKPLEEVISCAPVKVAGIEISL